MSKMRKEQARSSSLQAYIMKVASFHQAMDDYASIFDRAARRIMCSWSRYLDDLWARMSIRCWVEAFRRQGGLFYSILICSFSVQK